MSVSYIKENNKRAYSLQMPKGYLLTEEKLKELQKCNPDLELSILGNNSLDVIEHKFRFDEYGTINIKLAGLTNELFEEMHDLNREAWIYHKESV